MDAVREDLQEARLIGKGTGSKIGWVRWGKAGGTSYQGEVGRVEWGLVSGADLTLHLMLLMADAVMSPSSWFPCFPGPRPAANSCLPASMKVSDTISINCRKQNLIFPYLLIILLLVLFISVNGNHTHSHGSPKVESHPSSFRFHIEPTSKINPTSACFSPGPL